MSGYLGVGGANPTGWPGLPLRTGADSNFGSPDGGAAYLVEQSGQRRYGVATDHNPDLIQPTFTAGGDTHRPDNPDWVNYAMLYSGVMVVLQPDARRLDLTSIPLGPEFRRMATRYPYADQSAGQHDHWRG